MIEDLLVIPDIEGNRLNFNTTPVSISSVIENSIMLVKNDSNKEIIIEIKEESRRYKKIANIIFDIISNYENLNIKICSFNYELVKYLKKKYPSINVGLLIGIKKNLDKENINFDFYSISIINYKKYLNYSDLYIWTINEKAIYDDITKVINKDFAVISDVCKNLL